MAGLPPHPPPFHPASPSLKSLHKFYSPAGSYTSLPSSPVIHSPSAIVSPTPVYPQSIMHMHLKTEFDPLQSRHDENRAGAGTPHFKKGELPRAGAVPLSTDRNINHTSSDMDTLRPAHPLDASPSHVTYFLPSSLYNSEDAFTIRYAHAFTSIIPTNGPNGGAALTEVPGLMAGTNPTRHMKDRSVVCFEKMNGTITYVFEAEGQERVEREVNLMDNISLRMSTVAEGACALVRGFYRNHRELGIDPEKVVPLGLVKKKYGKYVVVAGVIAQ
ncbi:unnamed protein product [Peniophora sp. CBMAI 1063]|nr:unnamed protein product [Peniophora sp. CBMAI 1063]